VVGTPVVDNFAQFDSVKQLHHPRQANEEHDQVLNVYQKVIWIAVSLSLCEEENCMKDVLAPTHHEVHAVVHAHDVVSIEVCHWQ
jgi:hypothetical protein